MHSYPLLKNKIQTVLKNPAICLYTKAYKKPPNYSSTVFFKTKYQKRPCLVFLFYFGYTVFEE